jgi:hypothetical protein
VEGLWVTDWATRRGIDPDHFGAAELELCAREAIQQGRSYLSVRRVESYLRRLVVQEKLGSQALGPKPVHHLVRDIVAVAWLEHHPDDDLTISKLFWHQDVRATLQVCGRSFDESHAVCRMEAWLRSRGQSKDDTSAGRLQVSEQESEIRNRSVASLVSHGNRRFGRRGRGTTQRFDLEDPPEELDSLSPGPIFLPSVDQLETAKLPVNYPLRISKSVMSP